MASALAPTPTTALALAGHAAALGMNGEVARGYPLPQFDGVRVDAVLSAVQERETGSYGGVYHMGDFKAVVAKPAFAVRPGKGAKCQVRGGSWYIADPMVETSSTYQFPISRFLR